MAKFSFVLFVFCLRACALAILDRENWRKAMQSRSIERGVTTTPLRKMIIKEPGKFLKRENFFMVARWFVLAVVKILNRPFS